jgi:hypothetical protein
MGDRATATAAQHSRTVSRCVRVSIPRQSHGGFRIGAARSGWSVLHQSTFLLALRSASPGTECASRTPLPHFLVDRPFAVVWLNFSWLPIGGTPFVRLAAHCLESRPRTAGADFGTCQTFAASPAEPGELPCWFRTQNSAIPADIAMTGTTRTMLVGLPSTMCVRAKKAMAVTRIERQIGP